MVIVYGQGWLCLGREIKAYSTAWDWRLLMALPLLILCNSRVKNQNAKVREGWQAGVRFMNWQALLRMLSHSQFTFYDQYGSLPINKSGVKLIT